MKDRRRVLALAVVVLGFAHIGANCVDGVTPDCSDPNIECGPGPVIEAGPDVTDSSAIVPDAPAPPVDAGSDADAGDAADADGG